MSGRLVSCDTAMVAVLTRRNVFGVSGCGSVRR